MKTYSSDNTVKIDPRLLADSASSKVLLKPITSTSGFESAAPILATDPRSVDEVIDGDLFEMSEAAGDTLTMEESDNAQYMIRLVTGSYEGSQEEEQDDEGINSEEAGLLHIWRNPRHSSMLQKIPSTDSQTISSHTSQD
jgi:hypothetical protein